MALLVVQSAPNEVFLKYREPCLVLTCGCNVEGYEFFSVKEMQRKAFIQQFLSGFLVQRFVLYVM